MNLLNFAENGKGRSPSIKAKVTHSEKKRKKKSKIFNRFVRREKIEVEKKTRALMYSNS